MIPPISGRRFRAEQPNETASGKQNDKNGKGNFDEGCRHSTKAEEAEISGHCGEKQEGQRPAQHRFLLNRKLTTPAPRRSSAPEPNCDHIWFLRFAIASDAPRIPANTTASSGFSCATLASRFRVAASASAGGTAAILGSG